MRKYIIGIFVIVTSAANLSAQDFRGAMLDLQKEYKAMSGMRISMAVSMYETIHAKNPYYAMDVQIQKDGQNYFYHFGTNEMLMNEKYLVLVDHAGKSIIYSKRDVKAELAMTKNIQFDMDSILSSYSNAKYLGRTNNAYHYRVEERRGDIKATELFINENTKLIDRMTYEYAGGQFVSIAFKVFEKNPVFDESAFSESRFLTVANKQIKPSQTLSRYTISTPEVK